jgi:hypothetical protein
MASPLFEVEFRDERSDALEKVIIDEELIRGNLHPQLDASSPLRLHVTSPRERGTGQRMPS